MWLYDKKIRYRLSVYIERLQKYVCRHDINNPPCGRDALCLGQKTWIGNRKTFLILTDDKLILTLALNILSLLIAFFMSLIHNCREPKCPCAWNIIITYDIQEYMKYLPCDSFRNRCCTRDFHILHRMRVACCVLRVACCAETPSLLFYQTENTTCTTGLFLVLALPLAFVFVYYLIKKIWNPANMCKM